jgi:hypothetical protein
MRSGVLPDSDLPASAPRRRLPYGSGVQGPLWVDRIYSPLVTLFCAITAASFAVWLGPSPPEEALLKGLAAGAGFVAASLGMTYQFANLSLLLWLIDGGYHVARFVLFGLVLGLWH